jgi:hypothetical protein
MSDDANYSILGIGDRRWALFASFITVVGVGLAIFTAGWAIYEYHQEQEARRVQYTLTVIDSWEDHGYRAAYGKLREAYAAFADELSDAERALAENNPDIQANIVRNFVRRIEVSPEIKGNVRDVMYFFNRLVLCINAGICSVGTAKHFFDDTISSFLDVYGPYIEPNMSDFPGGARTVFELSVTLNAQAR